MVRSIVTKLWITFVLLIIIVLLVLGIGLYQAVSSYYYKQITDHFIQQGQEVAAWYAQDPARFLLTGDIDQASLIMNAHIIILNEHSVIQVCNQMTHLAPGSLFEEGDLARIFQGQIVSNRGYQENFHTQMLSVGVPIKQGGQVAQALLIYAPVAPLTATVNTFRGIIGWGLFLAILLTAVLAFFLSRTLSRPLLRMNDVALNLAQGNYTQRVEVKSGDEIGVLGASLNLLTAELKESVAKERRLEEMRREFIANVSHELRTPISLIQGYSEAIMDGVAESAEQRNGFLRVIADEAGRLKRLVDDLLELSRLESRAISLEKEQLALTRVLGFLSDKFQALFTQYQIDFRVDIPDEGVMVYADPFRLEQVLMNLIGNAIRYTPGGRITVSARSQEKGTLIEVADTGQGIPEADLPFVFERFYRADKSRNRESGGIGIGLSIVKNIIEAHQGTITVSSGTGKGTVFTLFFPDEH